ncbi:MAG: hypothetical protein PHE21_02895 [Candidatus Dojkabacteria bacterium]|nr:hypothetical protein [Candidatus Dojkabacteria bacterium]
MLETESKEQNRPIFLSLDETGLSLKDENEIPKELIPIEPISEWKDREQLYTQVDKWLFLASTHLENRYNLYKDYNTYTMVFGKNISNPLFIYYAPENDSIYTPFRKLEFTTVARTNENIGIQKERVNIDFYKELANIARERAKFLTLMEEEGVEIDNWGEESKKILKKFMEDEDFKSNRAINRCDFNETNEITQLLVTINQLTKDKRLLDQ